MDEQLARLSLGPCEGAADERVVRRRAARRQRAASLAKFDGLMRAFDIDKIVAINISNLVSVDPLLDDYYFLMYAARAGNAEPMSVASGAGKLLPPLLERGRNHKLREGKTLHDQITRMVNNFTRRPKATELKVSGALGNVSFHSSKNPRQALAVSSSPCPAARMSRGTRLENLQVAEELYDRVIAVEIILCRIDNKPDDAKLVDDKESAVDALWQFLSSPSGKIPRIAIALCSRKGMRLFPRIIALLDVDRVYDMLALVFSHVQALAVVSASSLPAQFAAPCLFQSFDSSDRPSLSELLQFVDEVDCFSTFVLESVVKTLKELIVRDATSAWPVLSRLIGQLRTNDIVRVCTSKVGISLLTVLLSLAEYLRQLSHSDDWQEVFNSLFDELQGQFHRFFPLDSVQGVNSPDVESKLTDDTVVWQFLASLALSGMPAHHEILVVELRERILSIVTAGRLPNADEPSKRRYKNVSVFLQALGLPTV